MPTEKYDPLEEVIAAIDSGDPRAIAEALQLSLPLVSELGQELLSTAIAAIPDSLDAEFPALYLFAPERFSDRLHDQLLDGVETLCRRATSEDTPITDRLRLGFAHLVLSRALGRFDAASDCARNLAQQIEQLPRSASERLRAYLPHIHLHIGVTHVVDGEIRKALDSFALSSQTALAAESELCFIDALGKTALLAAYQGRSGEARALLQRISELPPVPPFYREFVANSVRLTEALLTVDAGEDASQHFLDLDLSPVPNEFWAFGLYARGIAALADHNPAFVLELLDRPLLAGRKVEAASPLAADIGAHLAIEAYIALGDVEAAERVLAGAPTGAPLTDIAARKLALSTGAAPRAATVDTHAMPYLIHMQAQLLDAWTTYLREGRLAPATAREAARILSLRSPRLSLMVSPSFVQALIDAVDEEDRPPLDAVLQRGALAAEPGTAVFGLKPRDHQLLALLAEGLTNPQISARMFVSVNTVKTHLGALFRKLHVSSRGDAVRVGKARGLI